MSMRQVRELKYRVFTKKNLVAIARMVGTSIHDAARGEQIVSCSIECSRDNGATNVVTGSGAVDESVFDGAGRLIAVRVHAFSAPTSSIHFFVAHGLNAGNILLVNGQDSNWVSATFTGLNELIENAKPQAGLAHWLISRPWLTWMVAAVASGQLLSYLGGKLAGRLGYAQTLVDISVKLATLDPELKFSRLVYGILVFALGALPAWFFVSVIVPWLFPTIEIDVGPDHLKTYKTARKVIGRISAFSGAALVGWFLTRLLP